MTVKKVIANCLCFLAVSKAGGPGARNVDVFISVRVELPDNWVDMSSVQALAAAVSHAVEEQTGLHVIDMGSTLGTLVVATSEGPLLIGGEKCLVTAPKTPPLDLSPVGVKELRASRLALYPLREFHAPNVYAGPMQIRGRELCALLDTHKAEAPHLREAGFRGWWGPIDWEFGWFTIGHHT